MVPQDFGYMNMVKDTPNSNLSLSKKLMEPKLELPPIWLTRSEELNVMDLFVVMIAP